MEGNNIGKLRSEREQGRTGHNSTEFQGPYNCLFAILLALLQLKYTISGASPFKRQGTMMLLFVAAASVHNIALREANRESIRSRSYFRVVKLIYHLSGGLGYHFLALILFPNFAWLIISIPIAIYVIWELYWAFTPHDQVGTRLHAIDNNLNDQHGGDIDDSTHQQIIINHFQQEEADHGTVMNDNSVEEEGEVHDSVHQVQILINAPHDPASCQSPSINDNSMEQEIV
ncbi:hypothetical protein CJ030_MR7G014362 [Morella rubra]|uniref:Uncharacterized protein n=1 Tax=Morella rubra TaxID=262757 RepID=A0A6A1V2Y2_9ROSI|nr:hypothetical protein CJ030_MR7G014334 [Morella rubra]KAB1206217.1 hypothetical protein CJ030_MR7G014362 [Morella rubra]